MLEESLLEFPGALVLVTHDRYLLERVSTEILALDGRGGASAHADYAQWEQEQSRNSAELFVSVSANANKSSTSKPSPSKSSTGKPRRLGYIEQREWDQIEARILQAENELEACRKATADPAVASDHRALSERLAALAAAQAAVESPYDRWAELEAKLKG